MSAPRLLIRVLGTLEVLVDGRAVPLGGPKQRAVLAALALRPGETVSTERLAEALWGEEAPGRPSAVLQVYVSNLRRELDVHRTRTAARSVLAHRPPGYALLLDPTQVDLARSDSLVAAARRAVQEGRVREAVALLHEALALHSGPLLADLTDLPWFDPDRTRVEEARLAATELRLQLELQTGREAELVPELEALTAAHPLRERFWELLIVAHYRCGRQADALRTYRRVRRRLQDELGVDPGPALRDLERFVLTQSAQLEAEASGRAFLLWSQPGGDPQVLTLDESRPAVALGRRSDNDLAVPADPLVSRRHALLTCTDHRWVLRDEQSSNGTFVNGERLAAERPLRDGDVIRLGETLVAFRWPSGRVARRPAAQDATVRPTEAGR